ncbi:hypothetical protein PIB30_017713 [Stylosanthes scabra]|uniref:Alpha/beta hydrolase fold-3 domain-containing protein n=1 Tax=Stylosanthes scabra TaxID=79078 RepID=A0ABU6R800_9FABA|nr:hypothetical protein [Stylosanthes scabra]
MVSFYLQQANEILSVQAAAMFLDCWDLILNCILEPRSWVVVMELGPWVWGCEGCYDGEVILEFPFFHVYKDGGVELLRPKPISFSPPEIKDVKINPLVSARLFLPKITDPNNYNYKFPLFLFFHGSGFCANSAFTEEYSNHVAANAIEAKVLAVFVEYAKFPARPPPACYDDALGSLRWVASHACGIGQEPWLNNYADLQRVLVAGNSAGSNLAHWVVSQVEKYYQRGV